MGDDNVAKFGIPLPHWDIFGRILPGSVFVAALWIFVVDAKFARTVWATLSGADGRWFYWIPVVILAYFAGLFADCFSWRITSFGAKCAQRARNQKLSWHDAQEQFYLLPREKMGHPGVEKAHIESGLLASTGLLLGAAVLLSIILTLAPRDEKSLAREALADSPCGWIWTLAVCAIVAVLLLVAAYLRQGYRVWFINLALKRRPEPETVEQIAKEE